MKSHYKNRAGLLAALAVVMGVVAIPQSASAAISGTKHNLSSTGTTSTHVTNTSSDLCGFCHTPHGATTSSTAPLWNKPTTSTAYSLYDANWSATMDASVIGGTGLTGSPSLGCLSCHNGVAAMDVFINAPGSGGYTSTGADAGYTWQGGSNVGALGVLTNGTGLMNNLGTDLRDDHPISIAYCGGGLTPSGAGLTFTGSCADTDFLTAGLYNKDIGGGVYVTWIDVTGGTAGTRQKTDLYLYTNGSNKLLVECGTCHDPHGGVTSTPFLRTSNTGSALCLVCHNK